MALGTMELMDALMEVVPIVMAPDESERYRLVAEEGARQEMSRKGLQRQVPRRGFRRGEKETKVAIIGHPNVGKSTLLNMLTGSSRAIVSPIAGTTRDAVDELVTKRVRSIASLIRLASAARARRT